MSKMAVISSPVARHFLLVQNCNGVLVDAKTGVAKTRSPLSRWANAIGAALAETEAATICVYSLHGDRVEAVDVTNGVHLWHTSCASDVTYLDIDQSRGSIHIGSSDNTLRTIKLVDGTVEDIADQIMRQWTLGPNHTVVADAHGRMSIVHNGDRLPLCITIGRGSFPRVASNGHQVLVSRYAKSVCCFDVRTGQCVWENADLSNRIAEMVWSSRLRTWSCFVAAPGDMAGCIVQLSAGGEADTMQLRHPDGLERVEARLCESGDVAFVLPRYCIDLVGGHCRIVTCVNAAGDLVY